MRRRLLALALGVSSGACSSASSPAPVAPPASIAAPVAEAAGAEPAVFDHARTGWPLLGAHAKAACERCHVPSLYAAGRAAPGACEGCHESPHAGHPFDGIPCGVCHSPERAMTQIVIDHAQRSGLELRAHAKLSCDGCHPPGGGDRPAVACAACHDGAQPPGRAVSKHGTRFDAFGAPPDCRVCHLATSWRPSAFAHATRTRFPIDRRHATLACRSCHRGSGPADFEDLRGHVACKDCHAHRTVHADAQHPDGRFTTAQCVDCHTH